MIEKHGERGMKHDDNGKGKTTYRLLALVKKEAAIAIEREPDDTVPSWPNLVVVEFIVAMGVIIFVFVLSAILNAPLEEIADPNMTPNPSKAPWYFLNLQELLLHMHPALAGVIVPGLVLLALILLPYIERSPSPVGVLFDSAKGLKITVFSAIYTMVWLVFLILFDEYVGVRASLIGRLPSFVIEIGIPLLVIAILAVGLYAIIKLRWKATSREVALALFTGFVISEFVLTINGSIFRGPGMRLLPPWDWRFHLPL